MSLSGASLIKAYIEKYITINLIKTKKQLYENQPLARQSLSIAYNIVKEMNSLILSNNANDFKHIKVFLREQIALMHIELKKEQTFIESIFRKTILPPDFGRCIHEAWFKLHHLQKNHHDRIESYRDSDYSLK